MTSHELTHSLEGGECCKHNTTMVAMMEPVAEQNPDEISRKNTKQVQWKEIMSPIGPTTERNIVRKPRIAVEITVMNGDETKHKIVKNYHGLLVHRNKGFGAVPAVHPMLGLIVTGE